MNKKNDRIVYRTKEGNWVTKKSESSRVSSIHSTQKEAIEAARIMLRNQGGGELTTKGPDGKIRSKDSVTVASAYHVFKNPESGWSVKKSGSEKAVKVFVKRKEAIEFAKEKSRQERNDLVIHSKDGRIQSKDSFGNEPNPPRDRKY
jgi:hypothetical protein